MKIFKKLNSKAFGHLELLLIIVVVVAIAGTGYFVYQHHKNNGVAHAGSYTPIGSLSTTWPAGTATESLLACKQSLNATTNNVTVLAVANSIAQVQGQGVLMPQPGASNPLINPVAENLKLQSVKDGKVISNNSVPIINPALGGAGGGNESTRSQDLASASVSLAISTTNRFRVFFWQYGPGGNGFKATLWTNHPNNVSGFDFNSGVKVSKLTNC